MFESAPANWLLLASGCMVCAVSVVMMAAGAALLYHRNVRPANYWQQAADTAGLTVASRGGMFSTPSLSGAFRRHPVTVFVQIRGGGRGKSYTTVRMTVANSHAMRLMISPNVSALFRLDYGLSLPDVVKTGDEAFDRDFVVRCNSPEYAASLPGNAGLRQNLAEVKSYTTAFLLELKDTVLEYRAMGIERNPDRLLTSLNLAADLADRIDTP